MQPKWETYATYYSHQYRVQHLPNAPIDGMDIWGGWTELKLVDFMPLMATIIS
jgi:hypothetical protein